MFVYEKGRDGTGDSSFPIVKDASQFCVTHAKSSKSNPVARWHICQGTINAVSFSPDGRYMATAGRDGIVL
ncbi:WD repeat-containing protein, partial [Drosera capensis]